MKAPAQPCPCCTGQKPSMGSWRALCGPCYRPWDRFIECDGKAHPVSLIKRVKGLRWAS